MAINYSKTAWVNGSPPAITATNLDKLENAVKAAADELDFEVKEKLYGIS